jgi:hypothetical protein
VSVVTSDIGYAKASKILDGFIPNPKLKLLDQVSEVMRFKHYSLRTERTYREWIKIKRYILFHGKRHPREMGQWRSVASSVILRFEARSQRRPKTRRSMRCCFSTGKCCIRSWTVGGCGPRKAASAPAGGADQNGNQARSVSQ